MALRLGKQLEPLIWKAATGRLPTGKAPARAKPRRTREQVLAGVAEAQAMRDAARARYAAQVGNTPREIQAGGGGGDDAGE